LKPKSTKKTINRVLLQNNYLFRNLEKYRTRRSKGGEGRRAKELSKEGNSPPPLGEEESRLLCMHIFTLLF
jgi:hypothetical protein